MRLPRDASEAEKENGKLVGADGSELHRIRTVDVPCRLAWPTVRQGGGRGMSSQWCVQESAIARGSGDLSRPEVK